MNLMIKQLLRYLREKRLQSLLEEKENVERMLKKAKKSSSPLLKTSNHSGNISFIDHLARCQEVKKLEERKRALEEKIRKLNNKLSEVSPQEDQSMKYKNGKPIYAGTVKKRF